MQLGQQCRITSSLLHKENNVPQPCDAAIVSVDLKNADSITALKEISARFKAAKRKIYILDQKARLHVAQAYALGATHVLFNPVTAQSLLAVLIDARQPTEFTADASPETSNGARGVASAGAASLALTGMHGKLEAPLVKAFREVALNR